MAPKMEGGTMRVYIGRFELVDKPRITHSFPLSQIEEAYKLFESKEDGVIKVSITNR